MSNSHVETSAAGSQIEDEKASVEKYRVSNDVTGTFAEDINPNAERALIRKLDVAFLPLFTLIYMLNFVDRTAIGNAKIAGLEHDLGMAGVDYNVMLTIFFLAYFIFEIPSNLALKHFGSVWLALMVVIFGIATICTAFVQNYGGLIATRVILGIAEGGMLPGLSYILSRYYRRSELVMRIGVFVGLGPSLAGAFGGLLASGLLHISDIGTVKSWRKIFLVEGVITTGIGLLCVLFMPADPQKTRLLSEPERALALARLSADQVIATRGRKERTTLRLVIRAFNFNTAIYALCFILVNISFQGLSLFLPTVVASLGHFTTVESQLRTVPPYVVSAVWALVNAYISLRMKKRAVPLIVSALLMVIGYVIAVGTKNDHARYAACFLSIAGSAPTGPMLVTWGADNAAPDTVKAVTTALIPCFGVVGSIIAVWTYLPADAPNFHQGNSLNLATSILTCILVAIGAAYVRWENGKRERGERDYRLVGKSEDELVQLGSLHPSFRYQI
ncbi:MFS general substrate transporter [Schizopora paradoxa]|uniref:MFS general substrate transporter n=1 Tax=Schizopora paradoxa TaxID=27342 RepID=A0A0H2RLI3_9AGAM|nr:MFS general substrate transporter [Schizopora paradoxa]